MVKDIRAGDTYKLSFTAAYDSAVYTPKLLLNSATDRYEKTGSGSFDIELTAAETADFVPGEYAYSLVVFNNDERHTVKSGFLKVLPDLAREGADGRTNNQKTLAAIEATLQGVATLGQQQTNINGKSISRYSIEELIKLQDHFKRLVKQDANQERFGTGNKKIFVRF